ncbi:MAG TPA: glycerol-3-phosphate acyltransferase [Terriglobia bacterium]|nr:glycerol-3-phosphate acyltransferase [Terriglobia bacterium]
MPGAVLIRCFICFLIGSIPFAVLAMAGSGIDIRQVGSGNPGFNNVLRVSKARAVPALIGDMGKGFLAVWLVVRLWSISPLPHVGVSIALTWLYGLVAVLGHCFSPFLKFNGGKGIATSGGAMLAIHWPWAVLALAYFAVARIVFGKRKWREAGATASLTTWVLFTLLMLLFVGRLEAACAAGMTLFLTWRHSKNLQSLLSPAPPARVAPATPTATKGVAEP